MNHLLLSTDNLISRVKSINGFEKLNVPDSLVARLAQEENEQWSSDWDEDHGFGSSDGTYLTKCVIDNIISYIGLPFKTDFAPMLSVIFQENQSDFN